MSTSDILNFIKISDVVATGGQPSKEQFEAAAAEGYAAVINLAPYSEAKSAESEADILCSLGLDYHHIPVVWTQPEKADFEKFVSAMRAVQGKKVLVHCAANYRVTAFYSHYAMKELGWTLEQANALMARVWDSNPNVKMSDAWKALLDNIRRDAAAA